MHYYIDGYNFVFRIFRTGNDLQKQRNQLILELSQKIQALNLNATVVFDAQHQPDEEIRSYVDQLEIFFTSHGKTADEAIIEELKKQKSPEQHTVVTSDKRLAKQARLLSAKTETIEEFVGWVNRRYQKRQVKSRLQQSKKEQQLATIERLQLRNQINSVEVFVSEQEEQFNLYLQTFETSYREIESTAKQTKAERNPSSTNTPSQKRKKKSIHKDSLPNEWMLMDYWLKAFENPKKDDDSL